MKRSTCAIMKRRSPGCSKKHSMPQESSSRTSPRRPRLGPDEATFYWLPQTDKRTSDSRQNRTCTPANKTGTRFAVEIQYHKHKACGLQHRGALSPYIRGTYVTFVELHVPLSLNKSRAIIMIIMSMYPCTVSYVHGTIFVEDC